MYEVMMYAGAVGCIVFFILSVILFIKNKIPSSIMYFVNLKRKGADIGRASKKASVKPKKAEPPQEAAGGNYEPTALLDETGGEENASGESVYEPTEFLDEANDSPTELLP